MMLRIFMVLIGITFIYSGNAQLKFKNELDKMIVDPDYKNASVGIHVVDLKSGKTIFGLNEHQLMIPASTMKLITSATAFEILGEDYQFETTVGYTGRIKDQQLNGNLVIVGGGDPALGSEYFKRKYFSPHFMDFWAQNIKATKIKQVNGDLVLDASVYDDKRIPDTWIWGDIGNYYGAGPSAFTIYDNLYRITFDSPKQAGKPTKIASIDPNIDSLNFINKVVSSNINRDLAYIYGSPLAKNREIRGSIPKNRKAFKIKGSILQPDELFAKELLNHLALNGVFVSGKIIFQKTDRAKLTTVFIQKSPTLKEITEILNHESVNLFAEHILKQLSAEIQGVGVSDSSISIVQRFWKDKLPDQFFMEDGSGLSHFNAVSPADFTSVLNYMYGQSKFGQSFISSLPIAGEGTLAGINKQLFPDNTLMAKSGSMTRVRSYVGYLKTDNGSNLAFAFMFNNFGGEQSELTIKIEQLLISLKSD